MNNLFFKGFSPKWFNEERNTIQHLRGAFFEWVLITKSQQLTFHKSGEGTRHLNHLLANSSKPICDTLIFDLEDMAQEDYGIRYLQI